MKKVTEFSTPRKPIAHYASYLIAGEEVFGVATLIAGGYSFRPEGSREVRLVSYKDVDLMLFGRCDLADDQWTKDCATGDLATLTGRAA